MEAVSDRVARHRARRSKFQYANLDGLDRRNCVLEAIASPVLRKPDVALQTCGFHALAVIPLRFGCLWQRVFRWTGFGMYPPAIAWER